MTAYATVEELQARLSATYTVPEDAEKLLAKASELIDYATQGGAAVLYATDDDETDAWLTQRKDLLTNAVCDQVEFWLEVGEEHDVTGLHGASQLGRVQIQKLPDYLGQRPLRALIQAGLYSLTTGVLP